MNEEHVIQFHAGTFYPSLFLQSRDHYYKLLQKTTEIQELFLHAQSL